MRMEYYRSIGYVVFAAIFLIVWLTNTANPLTKRLNGFWIALALIGVAIPFNGILGLYPSPWTSASNPQVTHATISGVRWFTFYQDRSSEVHGVLFETYRPVVALTGYENKPPNVLYHSVESPEVPIHFGYDRYNSYSQIIKRSHYLLIPGYAYVYYTKRIPQYPTAWLWTPDDLKRLHEDLAVDLLFNNGGFEIFYARTTQGD